MTYVESAEVGSTLAESLNMTATVGHGYVQKVKRPPQEDIIFQPFRELLGITSSPVWLDST